MREFELLSLLVATIGIISIGSMFIGTAIALVFFGGIMAVKVFVASLLIFVFCLILENVFNER